jgi:hypothetical protein
MPQLTAAEHAAPVELARQNRLRRAPTFAADGSKRLSAAVGSAFFDKSRHRFGLHSNLDLH